jgi:UrcA family protein
MAMQKIAWFTAACLISVGTHAPSSRAQPQSDQRFTVTGPRITDGLSERVSYRDLNLANVRDAKRLVRRVGFAVSHVCSYDDRALIPDLVECRSYAWEGAKPQIALAIQRAKQIASTGFSAIAPVTIVVAVAH